MTIRIPFFDGGRWSFRDLFAVGIAPEGETEDAIGWLANNAPAGVVDARSSAKRGRSKSRGLRPWKQVGGVCLHQTAVGPGKMRRKAILGVPVHGVVAWDGKIFLLWDPVHLLYHGHRLNRFTVGIEVDCRAAGVEGDERTVWLSRREKDAKKTPADVLREATTTQLAAAAVLVRYYDMLRAQNGSPGPTCVVAHRQGHASRASDPGSRIWKGVKARLADYGIKYPEDEVWGSGKPVPEEWR